MSGTSRRRGAVVAATLLLVTGCGSSAGSLERDVRDFPGVVRVRVQDNDGDGFPLASVPKQARVLMAAESTRAEVLAVFDELVSHDEVEGVEVVLEGPKHATLATGAGVRATAPMVAGLLRAQADPEVRRFRHEAYPVLPLVEIELSSGRFGDAVTVADRYSRDAGLQAVFVTAGEFSLGRDRVNEDIRLTGRREAFVAEVGRRFELRGALVSGRGPLRLAVAPADVRPLREYVEDHPTRRRVGRVVVGTDARPPV